MKAKQVDRAARGDTPAASPPEPGKRCPKCHRKRAKELGQRCVLCNPIAPSKNDPLRRAGWIRKSPQRLDVGDYA